MEGVQMQVNAVVSVFVDLALRNVSIGIILKGWLWIRATVPAMQNVTFIQEVQKLNTTHQLNCVYKNDSQIKIEDSGLLKVKCLRE